ncbi:winged helix-turn-helix domain-containing protein [Rheinheimera sp. WS51]|uniref:winged helix-turn-helix domain-containing protein n=1 Tax=Rheinheimera sp. WS51 TaxID=3425886 RepID=UPI003D947300
MTIKPDQPLQVGDWQYLPEQDKLVKLDAQGEISDVTDLDNLCQKVINYFIVNAGKLVTKDELLLKVWGIQDVSDGRVTRVIRVLRVALGDDTKEPSYIETIPKRGYRFIAPVTPLTLETDNQTSDDTPTDTGSTAVAQTYSQAKSKKVFSYIAIAFAVLFVVVALLVGLIQSNDSEPTELSTAMHRYRHITALDGLEFYHHTSLDERYLVYSYKRNNDVSAVLLLEDLQLNQRITLTSAEYNSFGAVFNRDATKIAYQRLYPDGSCEIRLIHLQQQQLIDDTLLVKCADNSISARIAWSPDDHYLVYPELEAEQRQMVLKMLALDSKTPEQLTVPSASSFGDYAARFSRKGDKLVFLRDASGSAQIWLLDLASRATQFIVAIKDIYPGNVDWNLDDTAIIYPSGASTLSRVDIDTLQSNIFAFTDDYASELQVTSSGKVMVSAGNFSRMNIKKVTNPLLAGAAVDQVVFSSNRNETYIEVNPNSEGPTAVVSRRSGIPQVWYFYPDGRQQQMTFFAKNRRFRSISFSPDGQQLLIQLNNQLWLLDAKQKLQHIAGDEKAIINMPSWAKSGESIYYAESKQGRWQIVKQSTSHNEVKSVHATDRELYLESPRTTYHFWRDSSNKHFYIQYDDNQAQKLAIDIPEAQVSLQFWLGFRGIYYAYFIGALEEYQLRFYDFQQQKSVVVQDGMQLERFSLNANESEIFYLEYELGDIDIAEFTPDIGSL